MRLASGILCGLLALTTGAAGCVADIGDAGSDNVSASSPGGPTPGGVEPVPHFEPYDGAQTDPGDPGDIVTDRCEPSAALVDEVDPARLLADLEGLVGLGERKSHAGQEAAAAFLRAELEDLVGVTVTDHTYTYNGNTYANVVATIGGSQHPDEYVMLVAHYDSTSGVAGDAPGADDNASGTTALLEIARVLAGCGPARSVRMVFFSNEEKGLIGSKAYVADVSDTLAPSDVVGLINLDMIAHGLEGEDLDLAGRDEDEDLIMAVADAATTWTDLEVNPRIALTCA